MTTSIHAVAVDAEQDAYGAAPFFGVSLTKLVVMSVCTFGLYQLYWCYKQWQAERKQSHEDLSPFWRAFFAPLWGFSLFDRIRSAAEFRRVEVTWSPNWLGFAFLILMWLWRLPDPYWLVSYLSFLPLLPVQSAVNRLNSVAAPDAPRNASYSGANVVMIVVGALLVALAIVGAFLPAEAAGPEVIPTFAA